MRLTSHPSLIAYIGTVDGQTWSLVNAIRQCATLEFLSVEFVFSAPPFTADEVFKDDFTDIGARWVNALGWGSTISPLSSLRSIGLRFVIDNADRNWVSACIAALHGHSDWNWRGCGISLNGMPCVQRLFLQLQGGHCTCSWTVKDAFTIVRALNLFRVPALCPQSACPPLWHVIGRKSSH